MKTNYFSKRIIRVGVAILVTLMLSYIAGCSGTRIKNDSTNTLPDKYTVAYISALPQNQMEQLAYNRLEALLKETNGNLIYVTQSDNSSVEEAENAISCGASGIIICPKSDEEITSIIELCNNNRVYFVFQNYRVEDEETVGLLNKCMYYAGNTYEDKAEQAKNIVDKLNAEDIGKIALVIESDIHKPANDLEYEFRILCAKSGIQIRDELTLPLEDEFYEETIEDWMVYSKEIEAIVVLNQSGNKACERVVDVIQRLGSCRCKLYSSHVFDNMDQLFSRNCLSIVSSSNDINNAVIPGVLLINEILTTKWTKNKPEVIIPIETIEDVEEAKAWEEKNQEDNTKYLKENFLTYFNKSAKLDELQKYVESQDIVQ